MVLKIFDSFAFKKKKKKFLFSYGALVNHREIY